MLYASLPVIVTLLPIPASVLKTTLDQIVAYVSLNFMSTSVSITVTWNARTKQLATRHLDHVFVNLVSMVWIAQNVKNAEYLSCLYVTSPQKNVKTLPIVSIRHENVIKIDGEV